MKEEKEKLREAREVMGAISILATFLGVDEQTIASRVSFLDKEAYAKIVAANKTHNQFVDMSIVERGRALGYEVVEHKNGNVEVSTTL